MVLLNQLTIQSRSLKLWRRKNAAAAADPDGDAGDDGDKNGS